MPKNNEARKFHKNLPITTYEPVQRYFVSEALPKLEAYFGRVRMGQPNIYDTPFAKGESTKLLLQDWMAHLDRIQAAWPSLYEFEEDMAAKVGPLSVMAPLDERIPDVVDYYTGVSKSTEPIDLRALSAVRKEFGVAGGLQLRGVNRVVDCMKKSTNSGSPYFSKRRLVTTETIPYILRNNGSKGTVQILPKFEGLACAIIGWRGQEGGPIKEDVKQRVVWMFPYAVNIAELQVYQPLIEAAQKFDLVPAWVSMESVDRRITKLFDTKSSGDLVICTDFTKFDQHFNSSLQLAARTSIAHLFNGSVNGWLDEIFPIKYSIPMAISMRHNEVQLTTGKHGMASGSGGTNADETLAHRALQYEAAIARGKHLNPNSQCLGDDGVLTYPGAAVGDVVDVYSKHGLEMNMSKQYASTQDCIYLRRWHHTNYRVDGVCAGVYSTCRALGRLRYLERFMDPENWGPKMVALRQLSIIENVKYHPLREEFAEFCMKRDRYRLGIDIPGFLNNLEHEVKKAIESMPDFMGYTKTLQSEGDPTYGINSWWIVNYLKSKR